MSAYILSQCGEIQTAFSFFLIHFISPLLRSCFYVKEMAGFVQDTLLNTWIFYLHSLMVYYYFWSTIIATLQQLQVPPSTIYVGCNYGNGRWSSSHLKEGLSEDSTFKEPSLEFSFSLGATGLLARSSSPAIKRDFFLGLIPSPTYREWVQKEFQEIKMVQIRPEVTIKHLEHILWFLANLADDQNTIL